MHQTINDLASLCGHYDLTDALFVQGYNMLLNGDLEGKQVLEVCCGEGELSAWLARKSKARITAMDSSEASVNRARARFVDLSNVTFLCGDAMDLSRLDSETFDLIVGQASMHHLAGNLDRVAKEYSRVLKPGGRLIFLFEPMGHNPIVSAIRAVRNSQAEWIDESNLFEWALRDFAACFSKYEIYPFGLLAYFCKPLPKRSGVARGIYGLMNGWDQKLFRRWPWLLKYAANFNVCYWK